MSAELILCIAFLLIALPISWSIAAHYAAFAMANAAFIGVHSADSSLLAILFAGLFAADVMLVIAGGHRILLICALASAVLATESMLNLDHLLNHSTYISIAVNAVIGGTLAREYARWMHGKSGRS